MMYHCRGFNRKRGRFRGNDHNVAVLESADPKSRLGNFLAFLGKNSLRDRVANPHAWRCLDKHGYSSGGFKSVT